MGGALYFCYLINHIKNADIHRAGNGTMAASHTQVHTEPFLVINKFMQGTLPPPAVFYRARVVSSSHQREISVVARIVTLISNSCILDLFICDLETMTGRADESTGVATDAV